MGHIFLYGPPGTGKSTIGKILARNLKFPFVDLDRVIESNSGMSIPQIMAQRGEAAFRDIESAALKNSMNEKRSVIALGGGALLREESRRAVESEGSVLLLVAEIRTLLKRLNSESNHRPLLTGDLKAKLNSLLEKRKEHYESFSLKLHVDDGTAEQNANRAQVLLGRYHLSAMGGYDVVVREGGVAGLGEMLVERGLQNPLVVTDQNVAKLYLEVVTESLQKAGFGPKSVAILPGEKYKNLDTVSRLWKSFLENGVDRKSSIVALGGGVIGDLSGFAASTFMRGVAWVGVPTTLLAMVDASLGGKTGIDLPEGKNLIGSFYAPKLVMADPRLLKSLPEAELISGLAEVVKHGVISDPDLFALCSRGLDWIKENLEEMVKRAMAVKIKVIEKDPYEKGIRATLNLGHTVGHAVELVSGFSLKHGEAIAIGIVAEAKYSARVGIASAGLVEALEGTLSALRLPIHIPKEFPREDIIRAMQFDKKKEAQAIRFALPIEIGNVRLVDVSDLESVLE